MIIVLVSIFGIGIAALYGGIGWGVAWILEKAMNINVNEIIFILVGIGLFILKLIAAVLGKLWVKKQEKSMDKWLQRKY